MPTSLLSIIMFVLLFWFCTKTADQVERKKGVLYQLYQVYWNPVGIFIILCVIAWCIGSRFANLSEVVDFAVMSNIVIIGAFFAFVLLYIIWSIISGTVHTLRADYDAGYKAKIEAREAEVRRIEEEQKRIEEEASIAQARANIEFLKGLAPAAIKLPFKLAGLALWTFVGCCTGEIFKGKD